MEGGGWREGDGGRDREGDGGRDREGGLREGGVARREG